MYLGRVVCCVWSTVKPPSLVGQRLLVIQPMTPDLRDNGKQLICLDATGAGAGETVYWVRGKEASFPFLPSEGPCRSPRRGNLRFHSPGQGRCPRKSSARCSSARRI